MTAITGNTFPVRVELRNMGGQWNAGLKAWMVPDEKADLARAAVASRGRGKSSRSRTARVADNSSYEDRECGDRAYEDRCAAACGY